MLQLVFDQVLVEETCLQAFHKELVELLFIKKFL